MGSRVLDAVPTQMVWLVLEAAEAKVSCSIGLTSMAPVYTTSGAHALPVVSMRYG